MQVVNLLLLLVHPPIHLIAEVLGAFVATAQPPLLALICRAFLAVIVTAQLLDLTIDLHFLFNTKMRKSDNSNLLGCKK